MFAVHKNPIHHKEHIRVHSTSLFSFWVPVFSTPSNTSSLHLQKHFHFFLQVFLLQIPFCFLPFLKPPPLFPLPIWTSFFLLPDIYFPFCCLLIIWVSHTRETRWYLNLTAWSMSLTIMAILNTVGDSSLSALQPRWTEPEGPTHGLSPCYCLTEKNCWEGPEPRENASYTGGCQQAHPGWTGKMSAMKI